MRIGRVIGFVTISRWEAAMKRNRLVVVDVLDETALRGWADGKPWTPRKTPAPEALVAYDEMGAGLGQLVALSEGREAACPFHPGQVPIDAYCAAILDRIHVSDPPG